MLTPGTGSISENAIGGAGSAVAAPVVGVVSLPLSISVVAPLPSGGASGAQRWAALVRVGAVDLGERLTGAISISAAEDAARVASLSVVPRSAAEMAAYEGAPVTIDVTVSSASGAATYRRFTGIVETVEFAAADRVATLSCRDGYQERIAACDGASAVESLFSGMAHPSPLVKWSADAPDPSGYFAALLDTMQGCVAIDGSGLWQAIPWAIGTPAAMFGADDVFDGSVSVAWAHRAELPASIKATLNFRYVRLHAAEMALAWSAVDRTRYVVDGVPTLPKSTVMAALEGIGDWYIKGVPLLEQPIPGVYPVIVGPATTYYVVSYEQAQTTCAHFSATLYRRWYQEVQTAYSVTIDMGGASDRDDSIAETIASSFEASAWESAATTAAASGIYQANAPTTTVVKTGYEGLPAPWPPSNSALDHAPDVSNADLQAAIRAVVARCVRRAAAGKRKQGVSFERPLDPRFDIGAVLAVNAYGVAATGQLVEFTDTLDHDTGEASTAFRIACPAGNGTSTGFTASAPYPAASVGHALPVPLLGNHTGASTLTAPNPAEDSLTGFLFNVVGTGTTYDDEAPVYEPQFRIVMPEIGAEVRDPLMLEQAISAAMTIASGSLSLTF